MTNRYTHRLTELIIYGIPDFPPLAFAGASRREIKPFGAGVLGTVLSHPFMIMVALTMAYLAS
jgi:hypothetical protein